MRRTFTALAMMAALLPPLAGAAAESEGGDDSASAQAQEEPAASDEGQAAEDASASDESAGDEAASSDEGAAADEGEAEEEPEEKGVCPESDPICAYLRNSGGRFLTGLNGIVTAPADPVGAALAPPKAFDKASPPFLRRTLGFGSGFLLMLYRTFQGCVDVAFAVVPGLPVVSPVPRYKVIPGFTHEDE